MLHICLWLGVDGVGGMKHHVRGRVVPVLSMGSASDRYIGGAASVHRRCRSAPMHRRYNQLNISGQLGCSLSP